MLDIAGEMPVDLFVRRKSKKHLIAFASSPSLWLFMVLRLLLLYIVIADICVSGEHVSICSHANVKSDQSFIWMFSRLVSLPCVWDNFLAQFSPGSWHTSTCTWLNIYTNNEALAFGHFVRRHNTGYLPALKVVPPLNAFLESFTTCNEPANATIKFTWRNRKAQQRVQWHNLFELFDICGGLRVDEWLKHVNRFANTHTHVRTVAISSIWWDRWQAKERKEEKKNIVNDRKLYRLKCIERFDMPDNHVRIYRWMIINMWFDRDTYSQTKSTTRTTVANGLTIIEVHVVLPRCVYTQTH